jgi:hypothetical protein
VAVVLEGVVVPEEVVEAELAREPAPEAGVAAQDQARPVQGRAVDQAGRRAEQGGQVPALVCPAEEMRARQVRCRLTREVTGRRG